MADRKQRQKGKTGIVMELLTKLQAGDTFIAENDPKSAQFYASKAGVKIQAVNCLLIENYQSDEPKTTRVTKITIV